MAVLLAAELVLSEAVKKETEWDSYVVVLSVDKMVEKTVVSMVAEMAVSRGLCLVGRKVVLLAKSLVVSWEHETDSSLAGAMV